MQKTTTKANLSYLSKKVKQKRPKGIKYLRREHINKTIREVSKLIMEKVLDGYAVDIPKVGTVYVGETHRNMSNRPLIDRSATAKARIAKLIGPTEYIYRKEIFGLYQHWIKWKRAKIRHAQKDLYKFRPAFGLLPEVYERISKGKVY